MNSPTPFSEQPPGGGNGASKQIPDGHNPTRQISNWSRFPPCTKPSPRPSTGSFLTPPSIWPPNATSAVPAPVSDPNRALAKGGSLKLGNETNGNGTSWVHHLSGSCPVTNRAPSGHRALRTRRKKKSLREMGGGNTQQRDKFTAAVSAPAPCETGRPAAATTRREHPPHRGGPAPAAARGGAAAAAQWRSHLLGGPGLGRAGAGGEAAAGGPGPGPGRASLPPSRRSRGRCRGARSRAATAPPLPPGQPAPPLPLPASPSQSPRENEGGGGHVQPRSANQRQPREAPACRNESGATGREQRGC